jgi:hypothetical protein
MMASQFILTICKASGFAYGGQTVNAIETGKYDASHPIEAIFAPDPDEPQT